LGPQSIVFLSQASFQGLRIFAQGRYLVLELLDLVQLSLCLCLLILQASRLLLGQISQSLALDLGSLDLGLLLSDQVLGLLVLLGGQLALQGVKLAGVL
jgi:hypothetical protein